MSSRSGARGQALVQPTTKSHAKRTSQLCVIDRGRTRKSVIRTYVQRILQVATVNDRAMASASAPVETRSSLDAISTFGAAEADQPALPMRHRVDATPRNWGNLWHSPFWPLVLATGIFGVDGIFRLWKPPIWIAAALDEPAHLATTTLLLGTLQRPMSVDFAASALLASVLIDTDHIPWLLGSTILSDGTSRPYAHSLLTIIATLALASKQLAQRRRLALGGAFGLMAHFTRDTVTSEGLPLFWPASRSSVRLPYPCYGILISVLAGLALRRARN